MYKRSEQSQRRQQRGPARMSPGVQRMLWRETRQDMAAFNTRGPEPHITLAVVRKDLRLHGKLC